MKELTAILAEPGKKGALFNTLPGLNVTLLPKDFFWNPPRNEVPFILITGRIKDLQKIPFTKVFETLRNSIVQEGLLILGYSSTPRKLPSTAYVFAQKFCVTHEFEFLTVNFSGEYSYFFLRRIRKPTRLNDPNQHKPIRYVLADKMYAWIIIHPRIRRTLKSLLKLILRR